MHHIDSNICFTWHENMMPLNLQALFPIAPRNDTPRGCFSVAGTSDAEASTLAGTKQFIARHTYKPYLGSKRQELDAWMYEGILQDGALQSSTFCNSPPYVTKNRQLAGNLS